MTTPTIYRPARITTLGDLRAATAALTDDTPVFSGEHGYDGDLLRIAAYVEPEGIDPEGECGPADTRPALVLSALIGE